MRNISLNKGTISLFIFMRQILQIRFQRDHTEFTELYFFQKVKFILFSDIVVLKYSTL